MKRFEESSHDGRRRQPNLPVIIPAYTATDPPDSLKGGG